MMLRLDPFAYLPEEVSLRILSFLKLPEIGMCSQVCKEWDRLASDNSLWKKVYPAMNVEAETDLKKYLIKRVVQSQDEILRQAEKFVKESLPGQKGQFVCVFPFNPEFSVVIDLDLSYPHPAKKKGGRKDFCLFAKVLPKESPSTVNQFSTTVQKRRKLRKITANYPLDLENTCIRLAEMIHFF
ncbi:F-box protein [Parachlamydia sp. AcF125]|uniref:F-box protein n=1 Tax=Parachlamydia sp. AcF125 TaxID=2795736 RepID=UPI001BC9CD77|nr:F-box protein [Parachlamydia sp. AcF125]MBS4169233.1 hypothetical protein [Parachlamydia sp. AcF125]